MNRYSTQYLNFLALEKNASPNTLASYRRDLIRYVQYLEGARITTPSEISEEHTAAFLRYLDTMLDR